MGSVSPRLCVWYSERTDSDVHVYDSTFDFESLDTQQQLLDICYELLTNFDMAHSTHSCVMPYFHEWVLAKNRSFPVMENASATLAEFLHFDYYFYNDVGFEYAQDGQLRVKWMRYSVKSYVDDGGAAQYLEQEHGKWQRYMDRLNHMSKTNVLHGIQICDTWVRMQLEVTAALVIASIIVSMVVFFVLSGWKLGSVEAISLSIIVGLSVDYCLHLVHGYSNSTYPQRQDRTRDALATVGLSIVGGAVSTAGAAAFLLFCTIQVLLFFGMVILANTLLSLAFALFVLPSMLTLVEPRRTPKSARPESSTTGIGSAAQRGGDSAQPASI